MMREDRDRRNELLLTWTVVVLGILGLIGITFMAGC